MKLLRSLHRPLKANTSLLLVCAVLMSTACLIQSCGAKNNPKDTDQTWEIDSTLRVDRVDPPFWWAGMEMDTIELLIYGEKLAMFKASSTSEGLEILQTISTESDDYLIVEARVKPEAKGIQKLVLQNEGKGIALEYEILQRQKEKPKGLSPADLIYLIMPDRFANGDATNDVVAGMNETKLSRDSMFYRHGGDLAGIKQHIDYLEKLGATALWLNPTLENDQPDASYHGYAATDLYKTDPRLGSNEDYLQLVDQLQLRDMKMIMDVVFNHWGDQHPLYKNRPFEEWVNDHEQYTQTTYRAPTLLDPYASNKDRDLMTDGWFDHHMPDLNQRNPQLAKYLIQNSIWWVEYARINGYRIDTYAYPDQVFMAQWCKALRNEYPEITLFGETWVHGTPVQAFFAENKIDGAENDLPGVTDFQLYYALNDALSQDFGWTEGSARLYYTLAKDYLYSDPYNNVVFLDNHDLSRFYSMTGKDLDKYKLGVGFLLTTRGTPMIYYGTEILMSNYANPDGKVREDFPGGWQNDATSKFDSHGRSEQETEAFKYVQTLANWRKENPWIGRASLKQYVPEKGLYIYERYTNDKKLLCFFNPTDKEQDVPWKRIMESTEGFSKGVNLVDKATVVVNSPVAIPPKTFWALELGN